MTQCLNTHREFDGLFGSDTHELGRQTSVQALETFVSDNLQTTQQHAIFRLLCTQQAQKMEDKVWVSRLEISLGRTFLKQSKLFLYMSSPTYEPVLWF